MLQQNWSENFLWEKEPEQEQLDDDDDTDDNSDDSDDNSDDSDDNDNDDNGDNDNDVDDQRVGWKARSSGFTTKHFKLHFSKPFYPFLAPAIVKRNRKKQRAAKANLPH